MVYRGKIEGGVVVLQEGAGLPDGTEVLVVTQAAEETEVDSGPTIWDKLSDLGRWAETLEGELPTDLAANHDHYLHGLPKRQ